MPEIQEFEELRARATKCIPNPSEILRAIDKAQVRAIVKANYDERTGIKLPKELKERLAREFHYSEKSIEQFVYGIEFD